MCVFPLQLQNRLSVSLCSSLSHFVSLALSFVALHKTESPWLPPRILRRAPRHDAQDPGPERCHGGHVWHKKGLTVRAAKVGATLELSGRMTRRQVHEGPGQDMDQVLETRRCGKGLCWLSEEGVIGVPKGLIEVSSCHDGNDEKCCNKRTKLKAACSNYDHHKAYMWNVPKVVF